MLTTVPLALGPGWMHPDTLLTTYGNAGFWLAALVIFAECGLLVGFFLPGDSLLFTVGLLVGQGTIHHSLLVACVVMTLAAFIGNAVGYEVGRVSGPAIFNNGSSRIFKQEYVDKTMDFFERHGPRAIVLARFVPVVRTFITVTAGVGRMDRRRFLTYSAIGALLWAVGVTVLGRLLGSVALIRDHIEVVLILVVLVSVLPAGIEWYRHRGQADPSGPIDTGRRPGAGRHAGPVTQEEIHHVVESEDY